MQIVVNARFSSKKTGVGRVIEELFYNLQKIDKKNKYYIYVNREFKDLFPIINPNFHLISNGISSKNTVRNHIWTQIGFQFAILRHRADITIIPGITFILYKLSKIIYFQHDLIEYHIPNQKWYKLLFRKIAFPLAIKFADKVVCVSANTQRDVVEIFNPPIEKLELVPNGINLEAFKPIPTEQAWCLLEEKYKIKSPFILYTGTLTHPQKNLLNLLEGFAFARASGLKQRLVFVGNPGKDFHLIQGKIKSLELDSLVTLTGYVPDADQTAFYSAASAFCFPSLYEGFGLPVLEAMACGCPVITSTTSSLPEVVGDAGFMVDPQSATAIGEAMLEVVTNEVLRTSMIEKGLAQAKTFSISASADKFYKIIYGFDH